jgi:hypothetical protein
MPRAGAAFGMPALCDSAGHPPRKARDGFVDHVSGSKRLAKCQSIFNNRRIIYSAFSPSS